MSFISSTSLRIPHLVVPREMTGSSHQPSQAETHAAALTVDAAMELAKRKGRVNRFLSHHLEQSRLSSLNEASRTLMANLIAGLRNDLNAYGVIADGWMLTQVHHFGGSIAGARVEPVPVEEIAQPGAVDFVQSARARMLHANFRRPELAVNAHRITLPLTEHQTLVPFVRSLQMREIACGHRISLYRQARNHGVLYLLSPRFQEALMRGACPERTVKLRIVNGVVPIPLVKRKNDEGVYFYPLCWNSKYWPTEAHSMHPLWLGEREGEKMWNHLLRGGALEQPPIRPS